jgi:hypothetical protein
VSGLVERLTEAATVAIANERASLEHAPGLIRRFTIDLALANNGAVIDATTRLERAVSVTSTTRTDECFESA